MNRYIINFKIGDITYSEYFSGDCEENAWHQCLLKYGLSKILLISIGLEFKDTDDNGRII